MESWLTTHEATIPGGASDAFDPYVQGGSHCFVAKVKAEEVKVRFHVQVTYVMGACVGELQEQIALLIAWIEQREKCPAWERIRILDTTHPDVCWKPEIGGWQITRKSLVTPEDYEQQFETLAHAGYSWINLSLYGVYEGSLIVGIELPSEPGKVPPGKTSINFSGPAIRNGKVDWQLRLAL